MGILQRGDPSFGIPEMHYTLPTPDCPTCGPTDYEDVIEMSERQWLCVKCGGPMPYLKKEHRNEPTQRR